MRLVFAPALTVLALLHGCGAHPHPAVSPEAVAVFDGGEITAREVDVRVLALAPGRRPQPDESLREWYEEELREMAVEELLLRRAEAAGAERDPEFSAIRERSWREVAADLCASTLLPEIPPVTAEELRQAYEERRELFQREDTRRVYHIFRRRVPGAGDEALAAELDGLRDRVLNGESFSLLAAQHSDSETRHREGLIGWVRRGALEPPLDDVIFALEEGVPSTPVVVEDGAHLFFTDRAFDSKLFTFEEVSGQLLAGLNAERERAAVAALDEELALPEGSVVPDAEQLRELLTGADAGALVMRLGDFEISVGEFEELREALNRQGSGRSQSRVTAVELLDRLRRRELVISHCAQRGELPADEVEARLAAGRNRALMAFQRQRELLALVDEEAERVRELFERSRDRYASPPTWRATLLRVAVDEKSPAVFARLDGAREALDGGALRLEDLATEVGGSLTALDWSTVGQLNRAAARLGRFVAPLEPGRHTPAFRAGNTLCVARVEARDDPVPRPFEEVEEEVRDAYLAQHRQRLYQELSQRLLGAAGFRIVEDRVSALAEAGSPEVEVDLDELERLLGADLGPEPGVDVGPGSE